MRSLFIAVATIVMTVGAAAAADQPIVIKFSHVTTPDTPKGRSAEKFKELAKPRPTAG